MFIYRPDISAVSIEEGKFLVVVEGPMFRRLTDTADDGLCTIDIVLKDEVTAATGTYRELSLAAIGLLHRCVAPHHKGGIAMGLGKRD